MYKTTMYQNSKSYAPLSESSVKEALETIKTKGYYTPLISTLRLYEKGSITYDALKDHTLPTYRFNFLTKGSASNVNLGAPTGLIYLDVDRVETIESNSHIYAYWKSPSKTGYAVLIKVSGLTLDNFKQAYDYVGTVIGVTPDPCARKAIQQTCLSYDPNLYLNEDSTTIELSCLIQDNKKGIIPSIHREERKDIGGNATFFKGGIRFNNIDEYFTGEFKDLEYRVFTEKVSICNPMMPKDTPIGKRHSLFYTFMTQVAVLNYLKIPLKYLQALATSVNSGLDYPMPLAEVKSIATSVFTQMKEGKLTIFYNEDRRILFNPLFKLARIEKMKIVNREIGALRSSKTENEIYRIIENWDFSLYNKITIKAVSRVIGKSQATIKRYWKSFKEFVAELNATSKNNTYIYKKLRV
jgi:hypothetical protein